MEKKIKIVGHVDIGITTLSSAIIKHQHKTITREDLESTIFRKCEDIEKGYSQYHIVAEDIMDLIDQSSTPQQMAERIKELERDLDGAYYDIEEYKKQLKESQQENQRLREGIEETKNYLFGSIKETKAFLNGDRGELTKSDIYQTKSFTRGKQIGLIMAYEKLELQTKQNKEG